MHGKGCSLASEQKWCVRLASSYCKSSRTRCGNLRARFVPGRRKRLGDPERAGASTDGGEGRGKGGADLPCDSALLAAACDGATVGTRASRILRKRLGAGPSLHCAGLFVVVFVCCLFACYVFVVSLNYCVLLVLVHVLCV